MSRVRVTRGAGRGGRDTKCRDSSRKGKGCQPGRNSPVLPDDCNSSQLRPLILYATSFGDDGNAVRHLYWVLRKGGKRRARQSEPGDIEYEGRAVWNQYCQRTWEVERSGIRGWGWGVTKKLWSCIFLPACIASIVQTQWTTTPTKLHGCVPDSRRSTLLMLPL